MFGICGIPPKIHFSEQFEKDNFVAHTLICSYQCACYCMLFRKGLSQLIKKHGRRSLQWKL